MCEITGEQEGTSDIVMLPELELHTVRLISNILFVKKAAKSLHDLLDSSSGGTDAGGFVSLFTTENNVRALLLFLLIISEKKDCLAFFSS